MSGSGTPRAVREIAIDRDRSRGAIAHGAGGPVRRALAHVAGRADALRRRAPRGIDADPPGGVERQQAAKQLRVRNEANAGKHRSGRQLAFRAGADIFDTHLAHELIPDDLADLCAEPHLDLAMRANAIAIARLPAELAPTLEHDDLRDMLSERKRLLYGRIAAAHNHRKLVAEKRPVA